QQVRRPFAREVGAPDLGDRVVPVAEEDALVKARRARALDAVERPAALGDVRRELLQVEAAKRPAVARVSGEERPLYRLRQVHEAEDRLVEVREMRRE